MDLITGEWDATALRSIRHHWGSAYRIGGGGDLWHARPLSDSRESLTARTPEELLDLIREDYFARLDARTRTRKAVPDRNARHY
jgi:hypothetical protein